MTHLDLYQWSEAEPFISFFLEVLEPISKIRLVFRVRRETVKKRSIHVVCEHFEPFRNTAMGSWIVFEIGSNILILCFRLKLSALKGGGSA